MNGVPIANHGEDQQEKGNQQKAGGFGGIRRVPVTLRSGHVLAMVVFAIIVLAMVVLAMIIDHQHIVRRVESGGLRLDATLRVVD